MGFDRFSAKLSARESMRINRPSPILVTLLYFGLTSLLAAAISYLLYDPISEIGQYIYWGYQPEEILDFIFQEHGSDLLLYGAVQLLVGLYSTFMDFGYTSYALRMARNEQPGVSHLFDGFARPIRVLWASILIQLFTLLWSMAVILPVGALLVLAMIYLPDMGYILAVVAVITLVAVGYRYRLTYYFIIDDPTCTARQAVRRSKEVMKGWKWSLFALDMSFFGWMLLSALLSGLISWFLPVMVSDVLAFWVMPYQKASEANFYDSITGPSQPSGGSAGPDYEYRAGDGPQPF